MPQSAHNRSLRNQYTVLNQRGSEALSPHYVAVSIDDFSRAKKAKIRDY